MLINLKLLRKGLRAERSLCKESRQGCPSTSAATAPLCCCTAAPGAVFLSGSLSCPGCESRSQQSENEQNLLFPQTKPCLGSTRTRLEPLVRHQRPSPCAPTGTTRSTGRSCVQLSSLRAAALLLLCCSTAKPSTAQSRIQPLRNAFHTPHDRVIY